MFDVCQVLSITQFVNEAGATFEFRLGSAQKGRLLADSGSPKLLTRQLHETRVETFRSQHKNIARELQNSVNYIICLSKSSLLDWKTWSKII